MNKLMLSVLAACSLATGGAAVAQDGGAECQAGSAWGTSAACGGAGTPQAYGNSGLPPSAQYPGYDPRIHDPRFYDPRVYDPRFHAPQASPRYPYSPYAMTRRDRDGDGVRNSRDRFPDDPSRY